jgi:hypothetical protein
LNLNNQILFGQMLPVMSQSQWSNQQAIIKRGGALVEAIILLLDMGVMLYLCWRIYRWKDGQEPDLGFLSYEKTNEKH